MIFKKTRTNTATIIENSEKMSHETKNKKIRKV